MNVVSYLLSSGNLYIHDCTYSKDPPAVLITGAGWDGCAPLNSEIGQIFTAALFEPEYLIWSKMSRQDTIPQTSLFDAQFSSLCTLDTPSSHCIIQFRKEKVQLIPTKALVSLNWNLEIWTLLPLIKVSQFGIRDNQALHFELWAIGCRNIKV